MNPPLKKKSSNVPGACSPLFSKPITVQKRRRKQNAHVQQEGIWDPSLPERFVRRRKGESSSCVSFYTVRKTNKTKPSQRCGRLVLVRYSVPRRRCLRASQSPSRLSSCCREKRVSGFVEIFRGRVWQVLTVVISANLAFCSRNRLPA